MNHPTRPTHSHTAKGLTDAAGQTEKNVDEDLTNADQVTFQNHATKEIHLIHSDLC